jgi:uncharacterized protein YyaL (SSP411 family)
MPKTFTRIVVAALLFAGTGLITTAARAADAPAVAAKAAQKLASGALAGTSSTYLRDAAAEQVRWQPYDDATLALARRLNRPLLIDIGAMWCHWCHVMDEKTYADPQVASYINQHFVPIKVDRDERPDLDQYYQAAAAELSGEGGWPLTCFALPNGEPFAAFGFLPPRQGAPGHESGMEAVLKEVDSAYRMRNKELAARAASLNDKLKKTPALKALTADQPAMIELLAGMSNAYDRANGGFSFGEGPKFYEFPGLEFALTAGFYGHPQFTTMALQTLRKMARGGVYDQIGGGFHRYSTDPGWQVPHFEKLSYDQALALSAYAHAFEISADPEFKQVAQNVAAYVENTLFNNADKTFFASQDADAFAGDDGGYYTWSRQELVQLLKPAEFKAAAAYFGLDDHPATAPDGRLVLRRVMDGGQLGARLRMSPAQAAKLIEQAIAKMSAARSRRRVPAVDRGVLVDRNALMDSGFIAAGEAFHDPRMERIALDNLDYLYAQARMNDGGYCHVASPGASCVPGFPADQVYMLNALLAAYQVSGQSRELKRAQEVAQIIVTKFYDPETGVIRNTKPIEGAPGWLDGVEAYYDGEMPSVQGVAARDFAMLDALAPDHGYQRQAAQLLSHAPVSVGAALMLATVGRAIAERIHGDALVVVDGAPGDPMTLPLLNAAQTTYRPGKVLAWLDPSQTNPGIGPLAAAQLLVADPQPQKAFAFVCTADVCTSRVSAPTDLSALINTFGLKAPTNQ